MLQAIFDFFTFWKVTGCFVADIDDAEARRSGVEFHFAHDKSMVMPDLFRD